MPGMIPTVLTVMCRAPMPRPSGRVEDGERGVHRRPVEQRLPHPHEDHVGGLLLRMAQHHLPHLPRDLERRQVAPEAHAAGGAEDAAQGAPGLGGDAERAPAAGGDEHRFDGLAVRQAPEELPRAVGRILLDLKRQFRQGQIAIQLLPQRVRAGRSRPPIDGSGAAKVAGAVGRRDSEGSPWSVPRRPDWSCAASGVEVEYALGRGAVGHGPGIISASDGRLGWRRPVVLRLTAASHNRLRCFGTRLRFRVILSSDLVTPRRTLTPERIRVPVQAQDKPGVLRELTRLLVDQTGACYEDVLQAVEEREQRPLAPAMGSAWRFPMGGRRPCRRSVSSAGSAQSPDGVRRDGWRAGAAVLPARRARSPPPAIHVKVLSRIARLVRREKVRERLLAGRTPGGISPGDRRSGGVVRREFSADTDVTVPARKGRMSATSLRSHLLR